MDMTDFDINGFLSQQTETYSQRANRAFEEVSSEAEQESRKSMQQLSEVRLNNPKTATVVALAFWSRSIASCQAAIILGRRGMGVDALTLIRSGLESLFYCTALLRDESLLNRLKDQDEYERLKQVKAMLQHKETMDVLTPANRAELERLNKLALPNGKITAFDCAKVGGLEGLYHGLYRTLSLVAAHSSLTTAGHAFGETTSDLRFGSTGEHLKEVFENARDCLGIGRRFVAEALKLIASE